ncbi:MAG: FmdE family protein [Candidatus Hydrothermarchaeales archaeon]
MPREGKKEVKFPSLEEALETVPKIHGHICTASYLGTRMGLLAMEHIKLDRKRDLCVGVEILTCAADGIAAATQCSFGSGRLVFLDHGKFSAIFCNWMTGDAVRVKCEPGIDREHIAYGKQLDKFYRNLDKVTMEEAKAEKARLKKIEDALIEKWSDLSDDEIFTVTKVEINPKDLLFPLDQQYIPKPITCDGCNDVVEKSRTVAKNGRRLCKVCTGAISIKELE